MSEKRDIPIYYNPLTEDELKKAREKELKRNKIERMKRHGGHFK